MINSFKRRQTLESIYKVCESHYFKGKPLDLTTLGAICRLIDERRFNKTRTKFINDRHTFLKENTKHKINKKRWTKAEIKQLKDLAQLLPVDRITKYMNRTEASIKWKLWDIKRKEIK